MQTPTQTIEGVAIKCPFCNGAIDISPDSVVTVCKYCGNVVSTRKFECETTVLKHMNVQELEEKVYAHIKSKVGDVSPEKREMVYLPIYTSQAHVKGIAVMEIQRDKRTEIKEVKVNRDLRVATYGRYGNFIGIEYVLKEVESGRIKFEPTKSLPENYTILTAQKGVEEAKKEIKERCEEIARPGMHLEKLSDLVGEEAFSILESVGVTQSMEGLRFWDAEVTIKDIKLLFFPVLIHSWKHKGSRYITIADGTDGSIIMSKMPVAGWMRFAAVGLAALLAGVSGFLVTNLVTKSLYVILALGAIAFVSCKFATKGDIIWK